MTERILVVDDEMELCDLIAFQLVDEGYEVKQAYSLHTAVEAFHKFQPDIVLSDMQMPGGTGLELFKELNKEGAKHKFYLLTGFLFEEEEELLKLGIHGVIKKPMNFNELLKKLKG